MKINYLMPDQTILRELGQRLARVRKQQGFSQVRLAKEAGIGVATLRRIEAGQDSQMETWLKIIKSLGMISAVDLLLPETFDSPMLEALSANKSRKKTHSQSADIGQVRQAKWGDE